MYGIFTVFVFVSAIVLQTSFPEIAMIEGVKPDLVILIVVYLGLVKGPDIGCTSGFFFGLIEDVYSALYLGSNALTKTVLGFFCGMGGKRLYTQSLLSQILCVGAGTVVDKVLIFSINRLFTPDWKQRVIYETVYNLLCCPFIVLIFRLGEKRFGARSASQRF